MKSLVLIEHDNLHIKPISLNTVNAACCISDQAHALVVGHNCSEVAEQVASIKGIKHVILADAPAYAHQLAENVALLMSTLACDYDYFLAPTSSFGKNIMPRLAALLDVAQISDVIKIVNQNTFVRPIYAGNALATIRALDPIKVLTIRPSFFEASEMISNKVPIETVQQHHDLKLSKFIKHQLTASKRPDLANAKVVVSGGRGLQTAQNFKLIEQLADCLNGAVGATRAAVDAGLAPNDYQVGQTGKIIAPDLYFAIGISGAIQHLAGMKDSRVIVAINKDAQAPIFQIASYGIVGDLFELLPQLINELQ